jgi:hypothetical protein
LGYDAFLSAVWGGAYASPFIGLIVGVVFRHAGSLSLLRRALLSLLSLYLAAVLFGLAVGIYDAFFRDIPDRIVSAVIIQAILAVLWGLTFAGWVLILWPLSFLNHSLLWKVVRS